MPSIRKDSDEVVVTKDDVNDATLAAETRAQLLPTMETLSLDELVPADLDVPSAVATVLGSLACRRQRICQRFTH